MVRNFSVAGAVLLLASSVLMIANASIPPPVSSKLRERALHASATASDPRYVARQLHANAKQKELVAQRVAQILANMTNEDKAAQCDQWYGNSQLLAFPSGDINYTALALETNGSSLGIIHDLYAPYAPNNQDSLINKLQTYMLTQTQNKIPALFVEEGLHGVQQTGKTAFPIPLANAASFNKALMYEIASIIAQEARAYGIVQLFAPVIGASREIRWGRISETFSEDVFLTASMALMFTLGANGGDASGAKLNASTSISSMCKHFVGHSAPQGGTNTAPVHIGRRELLESFAPQFEWAVRYGGSRGIMSAYHEIDGIPASSDSTTLTDMLRTEWDYQGWVLSDDGAVKMMEVTHYLTSTPAETISLFLTAGGNSQYYDYPHTLWRSAIVESIANGTLAQSVLDQRAAEIIRFKVELGLFENPYINTSLILSNVNTPAAQEIALRAAHESIVLLQNNPFGANTTSSGSGRSSRSASIFGEQSKPLLPLDLGGAHKTIAVIGPNADVIRDGDYSGQGVHSNFVTSLEGIQTAASARGATVLYEPGCYVTAGELVPVRHQYLSFSVGGGSGEKKEKSDGEEEEEEDEERRRNAFSSPLKSVRGSASTTSTSISTAAGLFGSYWAGNSTSGSPSFTRTDYELNFAWYAYGPMGYELYDANFSGTPIYAAGFSAKWTGFITSPLTVQSATIGVNCNNDPVRVVWNGQVIIDTFANQSNPTTATVDVFAGEAVPIEIDYSRWNADAGASTILTWSLISSTSGSNGGEDQSIARAANAASSSDVAILFIGENDRTVGEGIDSIDLRLPGRQMDLVNAVVATGTPVVVVLLHGRPLAIPDLTMSVPAILSAWFTGQYQGTAIADVLTGVYNPAGRSPVTWPSSVGELPVYYNSKPSARTGCYYTGCAYTQGVFPFGWGLSYTTFNYTQLTLSPSNGVIYPQDTLNITFTVTNTGTVDGDDVPQLYVRDVVASVTTPSKQLKGFERVYLAAGASQQVTFSILPERDLYIISRGNYSRVLEPGAFTFFVGAHSAATDLIHGVRGGDDNDAGPVLTGNFTLATPSGAKSVPVPMGSFASIYE